MTWVDNPENLALVRAALEQALREMIAAPVTLTQPFERGRFFLAYLHGRFGLDPVLVEQVS